MSGRVRTILVTGAAGYVGRLTLEALAPRAEARVIGFDLRRPETLPEGVAFLAGDITTADLGGLLAREEVDSVVHLASVVRAPKGAPADLAYRVDVEGTRRLLAACADAGVRRLVVSSSGAAYGYHADNPRWLDEADPLRGNDGFPYARHKRLVEEMLADFGREHPEVSILILRPGTVVGEGTRSPVTDLFEKRAVLGIRGSESPFVFIWDQDLVACILAGVFEDKSGAYNLAGDGALAPRELAALMGKPYLSLPAAVVTLALRVLKGLGLTEHGPERIDFLRYRPVLSNRRLKEEFGYTPRLTSRQAFELFARSRGLLAG